MKATEAEREDIRIKPAGQGHSSKKVGREYLKTNQKVTNYK